LPPLSVVVAARNEEAALPSLLAALARQTHPRLEVLILDDGSTDATAAVVRRFADRHAAAPAFAVRLLPVTDPTPPRKKHALTQGVAAARHPLLAFTDADCVPPPGWAEALARLHAAARHDPNDASGKAASGEDTSSEVVILGYSPYRPAPGLLGVFARYETFVAGALTAGAVGLGHPYMAVGRNLSYPRAVFERVGGFGAGMASMSGDDDLFVQAVHRQNAAPVVHAFDPATFVATDAPPTWRAWLHQKRRHVSAGRFYAWAPQVHLSVFHGTGLAVWLAPVVLGVVGQTDLGLGLLAAKLLVEGMVLGRAARAFGEDDLMHAFPVWSFLYALYHAVVVPLGLLARPATWGDACGDAGQRDSKQPATGS
jgi:cellulose synthase/poly-beta-1,6-N-acetylglucosamine synthase-like glycosyltransferase